MGIKALWGRGPVERAQPLFPSVSAGLLILILLELKDENRSPFVLPGALSQAGRRSILGSHMAERNEQMKSRSSILISHFYAE